MKLTGKCKKDFEKWWEQYAFENNLMEYGQGESYPIGIWWFEQKLTFSMKFGTFVDFFDSVRIAIDLRYIRSFGEYEKMVYFKDIKDNLDSTLYNSLHITIHEARTEAINKANKIYNEKHSD